MHDDEKVDLGLLDPSRDGARWEAMVGAVAARAVAARRRRLTLSRELVRWGRAAIAAAAVLAAIVWTGALRARGAAAAADEPVAAMSRWAAADEVPSTAEVLGLLRGGGGHAP